jgi:hypothetical protein
MAEGKKNVDPALAGFYEAMERTKIEKITNEILAGYLVIEAIVKALILRVRMRMPKIGRGDLATLFSGSLQSNKVKLKQ